MRHRVFLYDHFFVQIMGCNPISHGVHPMRHGVHLMCHGVKLSKSWGYTPCVIFLPYDTSFRCAIDIVFFTWVTKLPFLHPPKIVIKHQYWLSESPFGLSPPSVTENTFYHIIASDTSPEKAHAAIYLKRWDEGNTNTIIVDDNDKWQEIFMNRDGGGYCGIKFHWLIQFAGTRTRIANRGKIIMSIINTRTN